MPPVVRDDRLQHIICQIHMAEPTVPYAIAVGYGRLVPEEDFIQGLKLPVQLQAPVPAPSIALRLKEPLQLWEPFQEEALGHPVLLGALFIVRAAKTQVTDGIEEVAEQLFIQLQHQVVPGAQVCPIRAAPVVGTVGLHRGLLLAGVLHASIVAGGQTLIRACLRHSGQLPAPQVALIALILGRDQELIPIFMETHIHNCLTGPGRGVDRPLPARCRVQEYDLSWSGRVKARARTLWKLS